MSPIVRSRFPLAYKQRMDQSQRQQTPTTFAPNPVADPVKPISKVGLDITPYPFGEIGQIIHNTV